MWSTTRKQVEDRAPGRTPVALIAGLLTIAAVVAALRRRRARQTELPYGPPNESVPSHETLAPAEEQAAQTT